MIMATVILGTHLMAIAIDPFDKNTWPQGDRIWTLARAIASAEGYGTLVDGVPSNPTRLANPGDISDGFKIYSGEVHSGSAITHFPNQETGWQWLHDKLENIFNGRSMIYKPTMTFLEMATIWAGDWESWLENVNRELGTSPSETLESWYSGG